MDVSVGLLGPLEVQRGGIPVMVPGGRSRVVLAALALSAGQPLSLDVLADRVWGEQLPRSAKASLHSHVMRLRRILGAELIRTVPIGYLLNVDPDQVDVLRFRRLAAEAANLQDPVKSQEVLSTALGLWRGEPLEGVRSETLHPDVAAVLAEERLTALQRKIDLDLAAGRHRGLVAELRELTGRWPMRETLWRQLIIALSGTGRQADALDAYHELRRLLREELGVDPSGDLQDVYGRLLTGAPGTDGFADAAGDLPVPPAGGQGTPGNGVLAESNQVVFVPRRTDRGWRARNNLPGDAADFTGRDREMRELLGTLPGQDEIAQTVVIAAIDGMAGVGKTALAVQALDLARGIGDRGGEASGLCVLGQIHLFAGRYPEALKLLRAAIDLYDEISDRRGKAFTARHLGGVYWRLGRYPEALDQYREALAVFRLMGDCLNEGATLSGLGVIYEYQGRGKEALDHQEMAPRTLRKAGNLVNEAVILSELGNIYRRLGRHHEALDYHHRALALVRQSGTHYEEAQILNDLGPTSAAAGRSQGAATHHRAALALATRTRNPYEQARAHAGIAQSLYRTDPGSARRHRIQALAIITDLGVPETHLVPMHNRSHGSSLSGCADIACASEFRP